MVTPINVDRYEQLLRISAFDEAKSAYLLNGFRHGFDIGYRGPVERKSESNNIPLRIGSHTEVWNKIMKEIGLGREAGPFPCIPYRSSYIQSPIGLVPKAGNQTRMIFHLSFDFGPEEHDKSLNYFTPDEEAKVKY